MRMQGGVLEITKNIQILTGEHVVRDFPEAMSSFPSFVLGLCGFLCFDTFKSCCGITLSFTALEFVQVQLFLQ